MAQTKEIPASIKKLRSCIACGLIQTTEFWQEKYECPNCQINWDEKQSFVQYTSASYTGVIAIFDPGKSWCAQWERFHTNYPGLYALNNEGEVTQEIIDHLEKNRRPLPEWVERAKISHSNE